MMSKSPQDRYQSAIGLRRDLEYCKLNPIEEHFIPGQYDVSVILKLPAKLYGRDDSWAALLKSYDYCLHNNNKVVKNRFFDNNNNTRKIQWPLCMASLVLEKLHSFHN